MPGNVIAMPKPEAVARKHFKQDAALPAESPAHYSTRLQPWAQVQREWVGAIDAEKLEDKQIASLHTLSVDDVDGAICRGGGGLAYTPHAWSQLVALMRAVDAPSNLASVTRWQSPKTRHHAFADIVARSKRPRHEEGILRVFRDPKSGLPTLRAVVSGRHSTVHFDDLALIRALDRVAQHHGEKEGAITASVTRQWDYTNGRMLLPFEGDVAVGFAFRNSETGCASLGFFGSIQIRALDAAVLMPSGASYERRVTIASQRTATRRNHTLPRYNGRSGGMLTEGARAAIAQGRMVDDINQALRGAELLAEGWETSLHDTIELKGNAYEVIGDALLERGMEKDDVDAVIEVLKNDTRLAALPRGSAAHIAGAIAVAAVSKPRSYTETMRLQDLAGRFVLDGWKARLS